MALYAQGMRTRLTVADAAKRAAIAPSTWRAYVARQQAPAPDGQYDGRTPWWWSTTVERWMANRPGAGARTDRRSPTRQR